MSWFTRKKQLPVQRPVMADPISNPPVEIIAHKNATKEQVQTIKDINRKLNTVFERNHFSVKLFVAAGGEPPKQK